MRFFPCSLPTTAHISHYSLVLWFCNEMMRLTPCQSSDMTARRETKAESEQIISQNRAVLPAREYVDTYFLPQPCQYILSHLVLVSVSWLTILSLTGTRKFNKTKSLLLSLSCNEKNSTKSHLQTELKLVSLLLRLSLHLHFIVDNMLIWMQMSGWFWVVSGWCYVHTIAPVAE